MAPAWSKENNRKISGTSLTIFLCIALVARIENGAAAFVPFASSNQFLTRTLPSSSLDKVSSNDAFKGRHSLKLESSINGDVSEKSVALSPDEINPVISFGEGEKKKIVNAFGLWALVVSLITGPMWMAAMWIVDMVCSMNKDLDPNRVVFDATGKVWSKAWLAMTFSYPDIAGDVDRLKEGHGACLYVANHASWLDIPVLCTILDPVFKFISKAELKSVPCVGQQLTGGKHVLIDRVDKRSQLRTFRDGVNWLKNGVPLMAFPEGMRSKDGRLMDFKGGIFSMAVKAHVPIVPISVANTHAVMPGNALFPVQPGGGKLHVYVHPAIDPEGKNEAELSDLVHAALLSKLPQDQHPLPNITEVVSEIDAALGGEEGTAEKQPRQKDLQSAAK